MSETEPCDTCGEPCQGGVKRYIDATGRDRIGCDDEHACAEAYTRRPDVRYRLERQLRRARR